MNPTDSIVIRVYARIPSGTGAWVLISGAVFSTEQLGAQSLDASAWTIYYVGSFTYDVGLNIAGIQFHVDGVYNSRIANFKWSSAPTREWHNIESIIFNVKTRTWNIIGATIFELLTKQWNNLQTIILNLMVRQWRNLQTLIYTVLTKKWNPLDQITFNLACGIIKQWHTLQNIIFNISVKGWSLLDSLAFTVNLARRYSLAVIFGIIILTIIIIVALSKLESP